MRIAIVGAGISGLAAAHALHRTHEITVFEAGLLPGGHANTVRVDTEHATHHVDTGFIVFNDRNYPNFQRLLASAGVRSQPSNMSFGVSDGGDFEYNGASPNGLFAKRAHLVTPWFHRMIADLVRFNRDSRTLLSAGDDGPSLGDWLDERGYSRPFIERLIVPQASAVWSADPRQMWTFPARFLAQFFANHGMFEFHDRPQWRTIVNGSRTYVDAVVRPWRDRLRVSTPVAAIRRSANHVEIDTRDGVSERFDHVVIATHSDQALRMLADATQREHEILGAIPYARNEAVLHTDESLLPRRRRAWASWNYHLLPEPKPLTTVTYHMNRLQNLRADREFCVTLNRTEAIDPAKILTKVAYDHPVFTPDGSRAQARFEEISGLPGRTHYAGAYWRWGFHEDGVVSGLRAVEALR